MSKKVQDFIELWKEKRSLKALMKADFSADEIEKLQAELQDLGLEERKGAEKALKDVSKMLVRRIKRLNEKKKKASERMERSKKTKQACLAYARQEHFGVPHEQRRAGKTEYKMAKVQEREKQLRKNLKSAGRLKVDEKKKD